MSNILNARIAMSRVRHETSTVVEMLDSIEVDTNIKIENAELECDVVAQEIMQEVASETLLPYAINFNGDPNLVLVGHNLSIVIIETALGMMGYVDNLPFELMPTQNIRLTNQVILAVRAQCPLGPSYTVIKTWTNIKNPIQVKPIALNAI